MNRCCLVVSWTARRCPIIALLMISAMTQAQSRRLTPGQVAIPSTYFGMHIHHLVSGNEPKPPTPWPQVTVPAWRLWDVRTSWSEIEPAKGDWRFETLDRVLELARDHNTEVQLTFGFTPKWASARPGEISFNRPGGAAEPQSLNDWTDFVRKVAIRYRGRIHIYEVWNEPNLKKYWSGSPEQMVEMTRVAHDTIKSVDPSATIVSPSATGDNGIVWFSRFLGSGGGQYVDVIGYHFYVFPGEPEAMVPLIQSVESIMRSNQLAETPLWDTEAGWAKPAPFPSEEMGADYLARAFLLNWAAGVTRFYWYAWDNHAWVTLQTTEADNVTLTPAGTAFAVIQKWLTGAVMNWCSQDAQRTWTCQLQDRGRDKWIVWNADQGACLTPPSGWDVKDVTPLLSGTRRATAGCIEVGATPELLTK